MINHCKKKKYFESRKEVLGIFCLEKASQILVFHVYTSGRKNSCFQNVDYSHMRNEITLQSSVMKLLQFLTIVKLNFSVKTEMKVTFILNKPFFFLFLGYSLCIYVYKRLWKFSYKSTQIFELSS